jgi:hypothetical protein
MNFLKYHLSPVPVYTKSGSKESVAATKTGYLVVIEISKLELAHSSGFWVAQVTYKACCTNHARFLQVPDDYRFS